MTIKQKAKQFRDKFSTKKDALIAIDYIVGQYACPPVGGMSWAEKNEDVWITIKEEVELLD